MGAKKSQKKFHTPCNVLTSFCIYKVRRSPFSPFGGPPTNFKIGCLRCVAQHHKRARLVLNVLFFFGEAPPPRPYKFNL